MQDLLYSKFIEKKGLIVQHAHGRGSTEIKSGCILALDKNGSLVRYTHSRDAFLNQDFSNKPIVDSVDAELQRMGVDHALVVARVPYPLGIAEISSNGKLTVLDEKLWLKHCGDLPNCYDVEDSVLIRDYTPGF